MQAYLERLTVRLARGVARLDEATLDRHAQFFLAAQRPDGGFAGREGASDLYYSSFAIRSLAVLGQMHGEPADRAAAFLVERMKGQTPIVDFASLIYSAALLDSAAGIDVFAHAPADWRESVAQTLEKLRRDDGGYAKTNEGQASSTYHSFLIALCLQLIERPIVEPNRLADFLRSQRRDDGGFVEIRPMRRSGANPTAAAVALLKILDEIDDETASAVVDFLADLQNDEGGILANTRIPVADLLSTFTACLTLDDLGRLDEIDAEAAARYVRSLEQPDGGFFGASLDHAVDVEYSFYGLGALAVLQHRLDGDEDR
jgi:geranylgeranyl transferase type-2 subunit beta